MCPEWTTTLQSSHKCNSPSNYHCLSSVINSSPRPVSLHDTQAIWDYCGCNALPVRHHFTGSNLLKACAIFGEPRLEKFHLRQIEIFYCQFNTYKTLPHFPCQNKAVLCLVKIKLKNKSSRVTPRMRSTYREAKLKKPMPSQDPELCQLPDFVHVRNLQQTHPVGA